MHRAYNLSGDAETAARVCVRATPRGGAGRGRSDNRGCVNACLARLIAAARGANLGVSRGPRSQVTDPWLLPVTPCDLECAALLTVKGPGRAGDIGRLSCQRVRHNTVS